MRDTIRQTKCHSTRAISCVVRGFSEPYIDSLAIDEGTFLHGQGSDRYLRNVVPQSVLRMMEDLVTENEAYLLAVRVEEHGHGMLTHRAGSANQFWLAWSSIDHVTNIV